MEDTNYSAANWGFSWDDAYNEREAIQGSANLTENSVLLDLPFGELFGDPGVIVIGGENKHTQSDYLYGFSQDGHHLILKEARSLGTSSNYPGGGNQKISGSYLMAGRHEFDPSLDIEEIQLRLTGLKEWFARSPIGLQIDKKTHRTIAITYDLKNEKSYNAVLLNCDDLAVKIWHQTITSGLTCSGCSMSHDCLLSIELKSHLSFNEAVSLATDVARFFTFCLGFMAEILELKLKFVDCESLVYCHGSFIRGTIPRTTDLQFIPFKLNIIEDSVDKYLYNWLNATDKLRAAKDMVVSLMSYHWEMPIDLHYVASSQALEALTSVNIEPASIAEEEYNSYVRIIRESISDRAALKWISERMPSNNKGQTRRLREFCETYREYVDWLIEDRKAFIDRNTYLRNGYTHRDANAIKINAEHYEELYWHTEGLLILSYGVIWILLGMDAKKLIRQVEESSFRSSKIFEIRKLYQKQHEEL